MVPVPNCPNAGFVARSKTITKHRRESILISSLVMFGHCSLFGRAWYKHRRRAIASSSETFLVRQWNFDKGNYHTHETVVKRDGVRVSHSRRVPNSDVSFSQLLQTAFPLIRSCIVRPISLSVRP